MERLAKFTVFLLCVVLAGLILSLYENISTFKSRYKFPMIMRLMENNLKEDAVNVTSVVLATDSVSLKETLAFHCSLPCLQKVIVVWNNLEESSLDERIWSQCAANVTVIPQRDNSINNQYKPFKQIETDVVFISQAGVTLSRYDILLGLEAWKQFPHLIVGYSPWKVARSNVYYYAVTAPLDSYNVMLSDAFFIHKKYLKMYTKKAPVVLYNEIHSHYNGDRFSRDVLMNLVVSEHLKKQAVPQSSCLWIRAISLKSKNSISDGDSVLWDRRNKLLSKFEEFYNHKLPLYDSNWIITHKDDLNVYHRTTK